MVESFCSSLFKEFRAEILRQGEHSNISVKVFFPLLNRVFSYDFCDELVDETYTVLYTAPEFAVIATSVIRSDFLNIIGQYSQDNPVWCEKIFEGVLRLYERFGDLASSKVFLEGLQKMIEHYLLEEKEEIDYIEVFSFY